MEEKADDLSAFFLTFLKRNIDLVGSLGK